MHLELANEKKNVWWNTLVWMASSFFFFFWWAFFALIDTANRKLNCNQCNWNQLNANACENRGRINKNFTHRTRASGMIYDTEIVYVIIVLYFFLLYIKSLHVKSVCIEDEKEKKKKKPGVCVWHSEKKCVSKCHLFSHESGFIAVTNSIRGICKQSLKDYFLFFSFKLLRNTRAHQIIQGKFIFKKTNLQTPCVTHKHILHIH